jgi:hypothetical protein
MASSKGSGDRGDFYAGIPEKSLRGPNEIRIDANGRAGRDFIARIHRLHRFAANECDFPRRVLSFEGRQIHHRDGQLKTREFRGSLDAPLAEGRPFLDHDLIDGAVRSARCGSSVATFRPGEGVHVRGRYLHWEQQHVTRHGLANSLILGSCARVCCVRRDSLCDGVSASCRDVQAGSLCSPSVGFATTNDMRFEGALGDEHS